MQIKLLYLFEYSLLRGWGGHLFEYSLLRGYGGHLFEYSSMSRDIKLGSMVSAFIFSFYSFDYTVKSGGVCNRLPDLAYYPVSPALALPSYVLDTLEMSYRLRSLGSTFMYLYHLISIDL